MSTFGAYFRLWRVGWVLVREGVVSALPSEGLPPSVALAKSFVTIFERGRARYQKRSDRLAQAVERLGPSYVKIGQFLATRPDVVGVEFANDLSQLQDRMAFFPSAAAKASIEGSLGRPVDELYASFGEPIAAASIAQVHPAEVETVEGRRKVAVKVVRPGVRQRFVHDIEAMYLVAHMQERFMPSSRRLRPVEVTKTLEQTTKVEMDLRLEAAALSEIAENTGSDPGFRVPKVDWERTGRDVITMEWIDGTRMSDVEGLRAAGHDLNLLADTLIQSFLRHTLRDGFFHADMHPGNLFVDAGGLIVAVDMGIVGRLGKKERRFLAEILYGFITRDYIRVAEVHFEAGYVPGHHNVESFAQAIRAIGEPIHGQPAETISMGKLLTLLFEVTELFDMATRPELVMLQKTMVVVEGVSRMLNPRFNMWKASEPVVGDWIRTNLGPKRIVTDLKDGLKAAVKLAEAAPEIAAKTEKFHHQLLHMSEHGLRFDDQTAEAIGTAEARHNRSGRIALWVIALTLLYIAWMLS
ncbi:MULTISPECIES: 2-polyprenylphenol 6-hydroxylase [Rhizobium]|uniref:2-polyprenylphenol 6-hydroxylase n=1 Tax=Rhizobium TaxID=379 RepID=UPI001B3331FD|nr:MULTISPECIES: 2-polyprenylphenol 6-hydroxylase [Rhizobium]MBX4909194.1 2-polyprenylphenol 6-hydroxylase [Rhizobium bangladeshense]MBX5214836.1 2-polyprenylphenol 6-hydroxylase [Rhizobium sp. NLR9a]MBX5232000.1 2-polyprenylphenol 6-hydroxylase [Rhizobium sp. NLR4a]MBX5244251.1 2-polyprenylphenol 6-hydroxylase [Rhizobium sp. NLR3b]MBX5249615.1 2-polyprenylphenol 6-hydroxylase [Rhizobium sp. NLR4b]